MPLTWFAHQLPALGMKIGRRSTDRSGSTRRLDATAMCLGTMMPDILYSISAYLGFDTHRGPTTFVIGLPASIVLAMLIRRVLAPVGPAQFPDLRDFRLRSWAVLARRRPHIVATMVSAFLGMGSHIALDWFTHPGRPGVLWLGYDDVDVTFLGITEPLASVLQLVGHTFGSLLGLSMLWWIGRRRLLDEWYGSAEVRAARRYRPTSRDRVIFWIATIVGLAIGLVWGSTGESLLELIQRPFVGALFGSIVGAWWIGAIDRQAGSAVPTMVSGSGAGQAPAGRPTR